MKKGLVFYFIIASILFHLLLLLAMKHIPWQYAQLAKQEEKKQPIAIDLVGPLKHGNETVVPKMPAKPKDSPPGGADVKPKDSVKQPMVTARATPVVPVRPSPAPQPVPQVRPAPQPMPEPQQAAPPQPAPKQPAASVPSSPDAVKMPEAAPPTPSAQSAQGQRGPETPSANSGAGQPSRRLVQPSVEDLMRYANVDKEVKRVEPDQAITLDTDDLMYTSYMRGLKNRIEMVWKYPDSAQKDQLQGELVMRFTITKSGKVESIELLKSSGYKVLDKAAEQALIDASPFNPLPGSWNKERFIITGTFIYKMYGLYIR